MSSRDPSSAARALCASLLCAALVASCRSRDSSDAADADRPRDDTALAHTSEPAAHSHGADLAAPSTTAVPHAAAPNRDAHADRDTRRYISRLESPERQDDLQIDLVIEKLALPTDAVIGDLGCGPGLFALALAAACPAGIVYASDIEPLQLDRVRERIQSEGARNVVPVLASPADPHFPPARLDVVFVADTYHHLRERVPYFHRLRDTLEPGGRLVILEYKPGPLPVGPPPEHKLEAGVLERELTQAGYTRVERFETHPYHDFEVWRVRQPWERD